MFTFRFSLGHWRWSNKATSFCTSIASAILAFTPTYHRHSICITLLRAKSKWAVVESTFLINTFLAFILFDSRATHSFLSAYLMCKLGLYSIWSDVPLEVSTPSVKAIMLDCVYHCYMVRLDHMEFWANQLFFPCVTTMLYLIWSGYHCIMLV